MMRFRKTLTGHIAPIYKLVSDGHVLFSGSGDGMVASWDAQTLEPLPFSVKVGLPVYSILIHGDLILIGQGHGGIHVVDRKSKKEIHHLKFHQKGVFDICHNPKTGHYYSTGGEGSLAIFDENFKLIMPIGLSATKLRRLSLSADGNDLLISGSNGYVQQIDTEFFNQLASFHAHEGGTYALMRLSDNRLLTGGRDAHLRFWKRDEEGWNPDGHIEAHNYAIYDAVRIDPKHFASAARDRLVKIWDTTDLSRPKRLLHGGKTTHKNSANTLCMIGDRLFTAGDDRVIHVWEK